VQRASDGQEDSRIQCMWRISARGIVASRRYSSVCQQSVSYYYGDIRLYNRTSTCRLDDRFPGSCFAKMDIDVISQFPRTTMKPQKCVSCSPGIYRLTLGHRYRYLHSGEMRFGRARLTRSRRDRRAPMCELPNRSYIY
jgi:hypothetical protein